MVWYERLCFLFLFCFVVNSKHGVAQGSGTDVITATLVMSDAGYALPFALDCVEHSCVVWKKKKKKKNVCNVE